MRQSPCVRNCWGNFHLGRTVECLLLYLWNDSRQLFSGEFSPDSTSAPTRVLATLATVLHCPTLSVGPTLLGRLPAGWLQSLQPSSMPGLQHSSPPALQAPTGGPRDWAAQAQPSRVG